MRGSRPIACVPVRREARASDAADACGLFYRGAMHRPPLHAMRRFLCASAAPPTEKIRLYRLKQITLLRALLRVKVLQLGGGVAVLLPSASLIANGGLPSLAEGGMIVAIVGGTLVAGSTLSWYAERIVGELAWLPASKTLRISTLTMWGDRHDRNLSLDELAHDGLTSPPPPQQDGEPGGEYPEPGFVPLELGGTTYIFVWGAQHVVQPEALARLLKRDQLPFSDRDPNGVVAAVTRPLTPPPSRGEGSEEDIRFF